MTRGIAVIGASDRNFWAGHAVRNVEGFGYDGEIWLVNPNYETILGRPAYASVDDLPGELDAAVVAVAGHRCPEIVAGLVARGCEDIVVVSDGFAERGHADGILLQERLIAACAPGTRLYGPNGVGFADFRRRLCVIAEPIPVQTQAGNVALISQSGAVVSSMMGALHEDGAALDWAVSLGNAAQFDLARAIDHVCGRASTEIVCIYAESLGADPVRLGAALTRAADRDLPVVMLKAGRTAKSARIALSHTASVAGDDAQVDAFLAQHGVIRVGTFEELARVTVLRGVMRSSRRPGGVVCIGSSGGGAAVASELAERERLDLAALTPDTRTLLRESAGPGSFLENPFDIVGRPGQKSAVPDMYRAVFEDPTVAFALSPWTVVFADETEGRQVHRANAEMVARTAAATGMPTVISSLTHVPWTDWMLRFREQNPHIGVVRGLETSIRALARIFPAPDTVDGPGHAGEDASTARDDRVVGEIEGRQIVETLGVPVVAGIVCADADEAVAAYDALGGPVVVKLDLRGVAHKSHVGAVTLGCRSADEVRDAVEASMKRIHELGMGEDVVGVLVESTADGAQLLVGLSRSDLGCFVTIGAGGVGAGAGTPASTLLLPAPGGAVEGATRRALALTGGPVDGPGQAVVVEAVHRLAAAFLDGALTGFDTVELNPMFVSAAAACAADVLLVRKEGLR